MEIRQRINEKIIAAVKRSGMTHAQVAASAGMSRRRLMLRILAAMGYRAKISFSRAGRAAQGEPLIGQCTLSLRCQHNTAAVFAVSGESSGGNLFGFAPFGCMLHNT